MSIADHSPVLVPRLAALPGKFRTILQTKNGVKNSPVHIFGLRQSQVTELLQPRSSQVSFRRLAVDCPLLCEDFDPYVGGQTSLLQKEALQLF